MRSHLRIFAASVALMLAGTNFAAAQERLPWEPQGGTGGYGAPGAGQGGYVPPAPRGYDAPPAPGGPAPWGQSQSGNGQQSWGGQPAPGAGYERQTERQTYGAPSSRAGTSDAYRPSQQTYSGAGGGYGAPYGQPPAGASEPYDRNYGAPPPRQGYGAPGYAAEEPQRGYYTQNEIVNAGHSFFGSVSKGLASAIEWAFQKSGRPNGYILGEDAGGAFIAGLRYGEGLLHTKDAGRHKVYWQGPSVGYDVGAEGSKTMVLVYNLRAPAEIYRRFGGVQGAAYLVGGVSVQLQKHDDVVLAVIRSGLGVRLGANIGYLKYTRHATWNPF